MKITVHMNTNDIFRKACEEREFGDKGDLTWREWYEYNAARSGFSRGELEESVAEQLGMIKNVIAGCVITHINDTEFTLVDLEEASIADATDPRDAYLMPKVQAFRAWLEIKKGGLE